MYSLQLTAFSLQPSAYSLQPSVLSTNQRRASMYLLCSDWSNRCLEEEEENCHLLTTTRRTDKGRGKNRQIFALYFDFQCFLKYNLWILRRLSFIFSYLTLQSKEVFQLTTNLVAFFFFCKGIIICRKIIKKNIYENFYQSIEATFIYNNICWHMPHCRIP